MKSFLKSPLLLVAWLLCAIPAYAQSGLNVTYTFTDFTSAPASINRIILTPLQPFADYNGAILTGSSITGVTGTNGSYTFTNVVPGYTYRVELDSPFAVTTRTNGFPAGLSGNVNGRDYLGVIVNPQIFAYLYLTNSSGGAAITTIPGAGITLATNGAVTVTADTNVLMRTHWPSGTNVQVFADTVTPFSGALVVTSLSNNLTTYNIAHYTAGATSAAVDHWENIQGKGLDLGVWSSGFNSTYGGWATIDLFDVPYTQGGPAAFGPGFQINVGGKYSGDSGFQDRPLLQISATNDTFALKRLIANTGQGGPTDFLYDGIAGMSVFSGSLTATNTGNLFTGTLTNSGGIYTSSGKQAMNNAGQLYITSGTKIGALWHSGAGTIYWPDGPTDGSTPSHIFAGSTGNLFTMNGNQFADTNGVLYATNIYATNAFFPLAATASRFAYIGSDGTLTNLNVGTDGNAAHYLNGTGAWTTPAGGGGTTFNVNQFSSGSGADGTNIVANVPLTNINAHAFFAQTNATTGNHIDLTQAGILVTNAQTGAFQTVSNASYISKGTSSGVLSLSNAAATAEIARIDSTGAYAIGKMTNASGTNMAFLSDVYFATNSGNLAFLSANTFSGVQTATNSGNIWAGGTWTNATGAAANSVWQSDVNGKGSWTATPTVSGANITSLNAANLSSGNIPIGQLAYARQTVEGEATALTIAANSITYFNWHGNVSSAAETSVRTPCGVSGYLTNFVFYAHTATSLGVNTNLVLYVLTNGVSTGFTLQITGAALSAFEVTDTSSSIPITWTNAIAVGISNTAAGTSANIQPSWSMQRVATSLP